MEEKQSAVATAAKPEGNKAKPTATPMPPKKKKKWPKRLLIFVIIVAVIAFLVMRVLDTTQTLMGQAYIPETVAYRDMAVTVTGTGTIKPIDSYQLTALVTGELLEVPFEEGDTVEKDDVLFVVDAESIELGIQQQEIALQQAILSYESILDTQSDALKNLLVEASDDGIITEVFVDEGDTIAAGTVIATVFDRDNMKITLPFHATEAENFYEGQEALVNVEGTADYISGVVDKIAVTNSVGTGGTVVREITIKVENPGVISESTVGTASVGGVSCSASGTFTYSTSSSIVAETSGELISLTIAEGDWVYDGQVVGSFDAADYSTEIQTALLNIQNAQLSIDSTYLSLDNYTITSPIAGTIIEMNYKVGDNVDPTNVTADNMYMAVIYDMSALEFEMSIHELDISKVSVGQTVEVTVDALDGAVFYGTVDKININGTTVGGVTSYPVTVSVDGEGQLLPGMNVSAEIVAETIGNVLSISIDAVSRGNVVTIADEGALSEDGLTIADTSKLREITVTVGSSNDSYVEIIDGLSEGDIVVTENQASSLFSSMPMGG